MPSFVPQDGSGGDVHKGKTLITVLRVYRPRMSISAEALVRGWYEAREDDTKVEFWSDHVADDVAYHLPARTPLGGEFRGKESVRKAFSAIKHRSGGTIRMELQDVAVGSRKSFALVRVTAQREGKTLDSLQTHVFIVHHGKITDVSNFVYDRYAVDEFWN